MNDRDPALSGLEDALGYRFKEPALLRRALRHGSAVSALAEGSYERLEFLGDSILGHAAALMLFERFPRSDQGVLTKMKSLLTKSETLSQKASLLGLDGFIELGQSEQTSRGRERHTLLEDVLEALVAALALDGGWPIAYDFVVRLFADDLDDLDERTLALADAKTSLQEAAQAQGLELPFYRQVAYSGPDHRMLWVFEVEWGGEVVARGEGRTKRDAQQQAARRAMVRLGLVPDEHDRGSPPGSAVS